MAQSSLEPALFQITLKIFLCHGNRLLVLRDRTGQTGDLPGGRFGAGEIYKDWRECALREVGEELGEAIADRTHIGAEPLFYFPHFVDASGYEALGIAYRASLPDLASDAPPPTPTLSDEHDHFEWVSIADYDPMLHFRDYLLQAVRRFVEEF